SSAAFHASLSGSFDVNTRALSHQSGPDSGWRSRIRRQAVTRPGGSKPNAASAPAVSRTSTSCEAPDDRATYRRRSIGCTIHDASAVGSAPVMSTDPPPELLLTPLNGEPRPIADWVTLFTLALVALDAYTYES